MVEPKLGDLVRDTVSNFEGVALARMECLYEATTLRVHPTTLDNRGGIIASVWIEIGRLEVITAKKVTGFLQIAGSNGRT